MIVDADDGIAVANAGHGRRAIRFEAIGDHLSVMFQPPHAIVRNGRLVLQFVIESREDDGRNCEEPEHNHSKAGLKFAVHGLGR